MALSPSATSSSNLYDPKLIPVILRKISSTSAGTSTSCFNSRPSCTVVRPEIAFPEASVTVKNKLEALASLLKSLTVCSFPGATFTAYRWSRSSELRTYSADCPKIIGWAPGNASVEGSLSESPPQAANTHEKVSTATDFILTLQSLLTLSFKKMIPQQAIAKSHMKCP